MIFGGFERRCEDARWLVKVDQGAYRLYMECRSLSYQYQVIHEISSTLHYIAIINGCVEFSVAKNRDPTREVKLEKK